jgi:hypothetical protein
MQQLEVEAGGLMTHFELLLAGNVQPQEQNEALKDVVLILVANGLTEEVEHSQVEVVFLDFTIPDFEVVEKRNDEVLQLLLVVEV